MNHLYDEKYYSQYGHLGENYLESYFIKNTINKIAESLYYRLHPRTSLDAGCAMGLMVARLRELHVDAYGVDISEYAHQYNVARQYCWIGSITDPFPQKYDLITCVEVVEHLSEPDAIAAIRNLCNHSNKYIYFSSTSTDTTEPTHQTVREQGFWIDLFEDNDFVKFPLKKNDPIMRPIEWAHLFINKNLGK